MHGKTVYQVWLKKYGQEKADQLLTNFKTTQSKNSSGKNNPMYGKPAPQGSGNGWKGWYKNIFFRSLGELSYMVWLDQNNIYWKSAEYIKIKYKFNNQERTYHPDFILNEKTIIEIKPEKLRKSPSVIAKKEAAVKYCIKHNLEYKIITASILEKSQIQELINLNKVIFMEKYQLAFEQYNP